VPKSKKARAFPSPLSIYISLVPIFLLLVLVYRGSESLSVDEFQTYFVVKDSFTNVVSRALDTQAFSPLYFALQWAVTKVVGVSEVGFRLLSLTFIALTALVIFKIGSLLRDKETGALAALLFVSFDPAISAALYARPYAMGLFFVALSSLFLEIWIRSAKNLHLFFYVLSAALVAYCQYFFIGILLVHFIRVMFCYEQNSISWTKFVVALCGVVLISLPLATHVLAQWDKRSLHVIAEVPTLLRLAVEIVQPPLILLLSFSLLLAFAFGRNSFKEPKGEFKENSRELIWLGAWAVLPMLLLFLFSRISENSVFLDRFFAWSTPGLALLLAILSTYFSSRVKLLAVCFYVLLVIIAEPTKSAVRNPEDWQGASAYLNSKSNSSNQLVILYSGLYDLGRTSSLAYPMGNNCFSCVPAYYYPFGNNILALPLLHEFGARETYLKNVLTPVLESQRDITLVALERESLFRDGVWVSTVSELTRWLQSFGFEVVMQKQFKNVWVLTLKNQQVNI